jgi:hypothetical protein
MLGAISLGYKNIRGFSGSQGLAVPLPTVVLYRLNKRPTHEVVVLVMCKISNC